MSGSLVKQFLGIRLKYDTIGKTISVICEDLTGSNVGNIV